MTSQEQPALISASDRNVWLAERGMVLTLSITCGLSVANVYYNQPLLADMGREFKVTVQQIGFIPTLTQVGYAFGLLLLMPLGDRLERRRLILITLSVLVCAAIAAGSAPNLFWLSVASMVLGFSSIVAHLIIPMVAGLTPSAERGKVMGSLISGLIVSLLLARSVSGFVGDWWGWRSMYWIAAGIMLLVAVLIYQRLPHQPATSQLSYKELMQSIWHLVRHQPILRQASINNALIFGSFNAFWATLVFFLESPPYGYGSQVAGLFGLAGLIGAIASPIVGHIVDRWGSRILINVAVSVTLFAFIVFQLAGTHLLALILGVLALDLGVHIAYLSNQVRVYSLVPNAESLLNTAYMVINYSGGTLGSFLGALSWGVWQWNGVCALGIGFALLVSFIHFNPFHKFSLRT